jgi:hypothetical protein
MRCIIIFFLFALIFIACCAEGRSSARRAASLFAEYRLQGVPGLALGAGVWCG